jgi:hypothetical protein
VAPRVDRAPTFVGSARPASSAVSRTGRGSQRRSSSVRAALPHPSGARARRHLIVSTSAQINCRTPSQAVHVIQDLQVPRPQRRGRGTEAGRRILLTGHLQAEAPTWAIG